MIVQHNAGAANAGRMFQVNTDQKQKHAERLSSGYRSNRAADDAAGLQISEKLRYQIRGLDRGSMNIGEGYAMLDVADGGMKEIAQIMQRMRELAVQGANDTNTGSDRLAIQSEINALRTEVQRIANDTEYNGMSLLNNSFGQKVDHVTGTVLTGMAYTLGSDKITTSGKLSDTMPAQGIFDFSNQAANTTGYKTNVTTTTDVKEYIYDYTYDAAGNITGATLKDTLTSSSSSNNQQKDYHAPGVETSPPVSKYDSLGNPLVEMTVTKTYSDITDSYASASIDFSGLGTDPAVADYTVADLYGQGFNSTCATCSRHYSIEFAKGNDVVASGDYENPKLVIGIDGATDGKSLVNIIQNALTSSQANSFINHYTQYAFKDSTLYIYDNRPYISNSTSRTDSFAPIVYSSDKEVPARRDFYIQCSSNPDDNIRLYLPNVTVERLGIDGVSVLDHASASETLKVMDKAIDYLSSERSTVGAYVNRLEHAQANVNNISENTSAAESRLRDADLAEEMMQYSSANIISEAVQATLAQNIENPGRVLELLKA